LVARIADRAEEELPMIDGEGIGHVLHICGRIIWGLFEFIADVGSSWTPSRRAKREGRQD
jgi:hypothetical protein